MSSSHWEVVIISFVLVAESTKKGQSKCIMYIELVLQQFCDYAIYICGYTPSTKRRYTFAVKQYLKHAQIAKIDEVTEDNVRAFFLHGRIERKWQSSSYLTYYKSLLVFFRWCIKEKYLTKNPVSDIPVPKLEKKFPPKLTKQEALRVLEVAYNLPYSNKFLRQRNHAIIAMFLFAGLRKGELIHLKYADVDIENFTIFVKLGKGNRDRRIPMSMTLAKSLKCYIEERKLLGRSCPEFFVSFTENKGFADMGIKRLVNRVRQASGIEFTAHRLRHTFATLMNDGGCDIYSLSKMMGHSDIKTTTIYLAASPEHLRSQIIKHPLNQGVESENSAGESSRN
jgi:site-specific recombinase XerD